MLHMENKDQVQVKIEELLNDAKKAGHSEEDLKKIENAALFAKEKHSKQFRKSGEPYIIHPIATASILLSWHMDTDTIITGILHDVLEDTLTTENEILTNFGINVYNLVKYVTKVSLMSKENRHDLDKLAIENSYVVQIFLSMSQDIRGMIVKLADRYHNMTTIQYLKPEKQKRIATETIAIYSKVAGRLGMYRIKTELQDMSFAILNPEAYKHVKDSVSKIVETNTPIWKTIIDQIKEILDSYSIEYEIKERLKGIYSTWEKIERNYLPQDIHDICAIRIIVNETLDCYKILGLIHLNFNFVKNAFKDYVSSPKLNFYQSIHTTIVKNKSLLEVQIRTKEMDAIAEHGIAAHWRYKDNNDYLDNLEQSFNFISEVSNLSKKTLEDIKQITNDVVFDVLLLNNENKYVVNNRTRIIDLAYRFDETNFKFLKHIVINGRQVNLDTMLKPNDVIKLMYSSNIQINRQWLRFTTFDTTKEGIKKILENEKKYKIVTVGKFLEKIKNNLKENYIGDSKVLLLIKKKLKMSSIQEFLDNLTEELYEDKDLDSCFDKRKYIARNAFNKIKSKYSNLLKKKKDFYFKNIEGVHFNDLDFPACCNKIPMMNVVGKINKSGILEVHNVDCENVNKDKGKTYPLTWNTEKLKSKPRKFRYSINFIADWTPSIGNVISKKLISYHLVINELKIEKNKQNDTCYVHIILYASTLQQIKYWFTELSQELNIKSNVHF